MCETLSALCGNLRDDEQINCLYLSSNLPSRYLLEKPGGWRWGIENFNGIELTAVVRTL